MTPVDRDVLRRKLERITANLHLLEPIQELTLAEYQAEIYRRKAVERILQEIVEAAVDINSHILVESGRAAPDDLFTSFISLGDLAVLDPDFAASIAPSAGLRNRLVHEYDAIDNALVLAAVDLAVKQYPVYVARIDAYLSR
ncbi:MAG: DUF86 domain-containing protein [Pirellulales bacterium]